METMLAAGSIKKMISYCYLLAYCPPDQLAGLVKASSFFRRQAALKSKKPEEDFFLPAMLEACRRLVSFHQGSTSLEESQVNAFAELAMQASSTSEALIYYQQEMDKLIHLPGRAALKNRLHRRRGCALCAAPCYYGFFALISDPQFQVLKQALLDESHKPPAEQNLVLILWAFARYHLRVTLGAHQDFITVRHLGNLAFCLYLFATAKSRFPFQEAVVKALQDTNQKMILRRAQAFTAL